MSTIDNINGIYAKDTELRNGISELRGDILSQTIKPLSITKNGTYAADPTVGTYGYSPVSVNIASGIDYSITEQDTGRKWIDGKPIYQISALASGSDLFDANALNIDKLIKVEALGSDGNGYTSSKWTIEGISGSSNRMIYWDASSEKITYTGSFPLYAATIWYTKTTDTVE